MRYNIARHIGKSISEKVDGGHHGDRRGRYRGVGEDVYQSGIDMGGVSRWVGGECGGAGKGRADVWKGWVGGKGMGGLPKERIKLWVHAFPRSHLV